MLGKLKRSRFAVVYAFIGIYILMSFLVRCSLMFISIEEVDFSLFKVLKIFGSGLYFDLAVALDFIFVYSVYLFILPSKLIGSLADKILSTTLLFLTLFIVNFSFLGEFPFWEEFSTRYNFIAVDYLIYTYEVIENINQSYPIPYLISGIVLLSALVLFILFKFQILQNSFNFKEKFKTRALHFLPIVFFIFLFALFSNNRQAEMTSNVYNNELSKNGVFSFFAAYRSNQLSYPDFYPTVDSETAFTTIKKELLQNNQHYTSNQNQNIERIVTNDSAEMKPNIVLICVESLSADFMKTFGNPENLMPNFDKIYNDGISFTNMYATGTRTVRGMEAIALSVPPTPGNSIVRRPDNANLNSIASVLKQKNYELNFYYGGDGYFDNMNSFFGGQGFNIIDRNRGNPLSDNIKTQRSNIEDSEVTFENAWGVCDEDIYNKLIKNLDKNSNSGKPTFNFVMTTSNHKPYSFPANKIDLPNGSRNAAVKYTDFALAEFLNKAKQKTWFQNTVFVIIADHCASSAGKWEITINKHHIPAVIYNLPHQKPEKVEKLCSQIDIMPTLFGYLNWTYTTNLYGKDISLMDESQERALIGNYRTIGLLKGDIFTQINDRKQVNQFNWNFEKSEMTPLKNKNLPFENLTISYYQTASLRFTNGLMKEK